MFLFTVKWLFTQPLKNMVIQRRDIAPVFYFGANQKSVRSGAGKYRTAGHRLTAFLCVWRVRLGDEPLSPVLLHQLCARLPAQVVSGSSS